MADIFIVITSNDPIYGTFLGPFFLTAAEANVEAAKRTALRDGRTYTVDKFDAATIDKTVLWPTKYIRSKLICVPELSQLYRPEQQK